MLPYRPTSRHCQRIQGTVTPRETYFTGDIAVSFDSQYFAVLDDFSVTIDLYTIKDKLQFEHVVSWPAPALSSYSLCFTYNGSLLVSAMKDVGVVEFDIATQHRRRQLDTGMCLSVDCSREYILAIIAMHRVEDEDDDDEDEYPHAAILFRYDTGKYARVLHEGVPNSNCAAKFVTGGTQAAIINLDSKVRVLDVQTGATLYMLPSRFSYPCVPQQCMDGSWFKLWPHGSGKKRFESMAYVQRHNCIVAITFDGGELYALRSKWRYTVQCAFLSAVII